MADAVKRVVRIQASNDQFRQAPPHGCIRIGREVSARFSNDDLWTVCDLIAAYDFRPEGDLHDRGIVDYAGVSLVWKIEAWTSGHEVPLHNATDDATIRRTLRFTLAGED